MTPSQLNTHGLTPTAEQQTNMEKLAAAITRLEGITGLEFTVTSGLRTSALQKHIDPEHPCSAHIDGQAVDLLDPDYKLWHWLIENDHYLVELGLYMENRTDIPHVHLQSRPTLKRVFTA